MTPKRVLFTSATLSFSTGMMAKRGCGASSPGKLWTITSMEKVRINSRCSERTARSSRRRYGGSILLETPKWMGLFSFARTIYLSDDLRVSEMGVVPTNNSVLVASCMVYPVVPTLFAHKCAHHFVQYQ